METNPLKLFSLLKLPLSSMHFNTTLKLAKKYTFVPKSSKCNHQTGIPLSIYGLLLESCVSYELIHG